MEYVALVLVIMGMLFVGMLGMTVAGQRHAKRKLQRIGESATVGTGIVEGALFALLGLLIAFTFATSYGRFNERRDLAVQEANAIGIVLACPALRVADWLCNHLSDRRHSQPVGQRYLFAGA